MIRIFPDDFRDGSTKYLVEDGKYYLIKHKRSYYESIYVKGDYFKRHINFSERILNRGIRDTMRQLYWYWNDFRVYEMSEEEYKAILVMKELVN